LEGLGFSQGFAAMPPLSSPTSRRLRAALAGLSLLGLGASLGGCSMLGLGDEDTPQNNANKDAANYRERPIEQIYSDAWTAINRGNWDQAAAQFNEVDRQHPYSVWARRAMLMSAFCSYQANKYADAISTADQYISLHPGSHEVAYAFYLKAISLYEQIVDVGRDQSNTQGALVALQDVVQRFPDTEYARDAMLKIDLTNDHLAGKEMAVGRYYLDRGDYIGAINRFKIVVQQYQTTSQIAEALERLTEAYYSLGLDREAQTAAAVLGANYPGSVWYRDAFNILKGRNLKPEEDKGSWISQAFHKIL
jgi:outer membrane protein assembly factor BamD